MFRHFISFLKDMLHLYTCDTQPTLPDFRTKPASPVPPGLYCGVSINNWYMTMTMPGGNRYNDSELSYTFWHKTHSNLSKTVSVARLGGSIYNS